LAAAYWRGQRVPLPRDFEILEPRGIRHNAANFLHYTEVVFVALANVGSVLVILGGFRNDVLSDLATRIGAALNIPVMVGAIALVHWGRWNFVPTETHPMGGMEFQVIMALLMLYLVITGNKGVNSAGRQASTA
jgi:putative oxidoreductase